MIAIERYAAVYILEVPASGFAVAHGMYSIVAVAKKKDLYFVRKFSGRLQHASYHGMQITGSARRDQNLTDCASSARIDAYNKQEMHASEYAN